MANKPMSYPRMYAKLVYYVVIALVLSKTVWDLGSLAVSYYVSDTSISIQLMLADLALFLFLNRVYETGVLKYIDKIRLQRRIDRWRRAHPLTEWDTRTNMPKGIVDILEFSRVVYPETVPLIDASKAGRKIRA